MLHHLIEHGRVTPGEAESLVGKRKPATRRLLQRIAEAGYLERVELSPRDPTAYWRVRAPKARRRSGSERG
jgi:hypothetical protein